MNYIHNAAPSGDSESFCASEDPLVPPDVLWNRICYWLVPGTFSDSRYISFRRDDPWRDAPGNIPHNCCGVFILYGDSSHVRRQFPEVGKVRAFIYRAGDSVPVNRHGGCVRGIVDCYPLPDGFHQALQFPDLRILPDYSRYSGYYRSAGVSGTVAVNS